MRTAKKILAFWTAALVCSALFLLTHPLPEPAWKGEFKAACVTAGGIPAPNGSHLVCIPKVSR